MAESALVSSLVKLGDLVSEEAFLLGEVEGQIRLLRNELEWMRLFLEDADSERRYDKRLKLWVEQIRDAAFDAEDAIDEFMFNIEHHRQRRLGKLKCLKFLPTCVSLVDKLPFVHELDTRVREINTTIDKILANKKRYGIRNPDPSASVTRSSCSSNEVVSWRERKRLPVEEIDVVGLEDDVEAVKRILVETNTETGRGRKVVSIVGMGGLGKTTLAKKVFNDVKQQFNCHAFVYVSQGYILGELLQNIAVKVMTPIEEQETPKTSKKNKNKAGEEDLKSRIARMSGNELEREVFDYLQEKKYLIVLDDIWSIEVWKGLSSHFPDSLESRVLITSRNEEVALYAQSVPYQLHLLERNESRELFLKKVGCATSKWPQGLDSLGEHILENCKDLPLAIVTLGGLLSTKQKSLHSWQKVLYSKDWHLNQGLHSCLGILALSYNDLPYYLKSCFLYCGIFLQDSNSSTILAADLIRLWVAEGFVQRRGTERLEDIAEDYLHELIHRNMIQLAERKSGGAVKSCRIHDLLRDLAISEAEDAKLFEVYENDDVSFPISVRRLGVHCDLIEKDLSKHLHNSHLRSLIFFSASLDKKSWRSLQRHIRLLTVLDLGEFHDSCTFPSEIKKLIHLKFLCIKGSGRIRVPLSIGRLVNLQTLDLDYNSASMPFTIWKLQHLRHLICYKGKIANQSLISGCLNGHLGIGQLINLQTLALHAGSWLEGDGLGKLTQLRKLKIQGNLTPYLKEGFFKSIAKLTALRTMRLVMFEDSDINPWSSYLVLLNQRKNVTEGQTLIPGLKPFSRHKWLYKVFLRGRLNELPTGIDFYPPNLVKLVLVFCELQQDPLLTLGLLPNLRKLQLLHKSYVGTRMICSSGGFLKLESLKLHYLKELKELILEEEAMPVLRTLAILGCDQMRRLPGGLLQLPTLQKLKLRYVSDELVDEVERTEGLVRIISIERRQLSFTSNQGF